MSKNKADSEEEFLMIIYAAAKVGDGRLSHIKAYKRLLDIIDRQRIQIEGLYEDLAREVH